MSRAIFSPRVLCWALAAVIVQAATGCIYRNPATGSYEIIAVPQSLESYIGRSIVNRRLHRTPLSEDFEARRRVHRVAQEILRAAGDEGGQTCTFYVVRDKAVEALAVPGGHVFVTTGLLAFVGDDDDLLAAALAHEVAHVRARHVVKRLEALAASTSVVGAMQVGATWDRGPGVSPEADLGARFLNQSYEQAQEREADGLALVYLKRSGYPARSLERLLDALCRGAPENSPVLKRLEHLRRTSGVQRRAGGTRTGQRQPTP